MVSLDISLFLHKEVSVPYMLSALAQKVSLKVLSNSNENLLVQQQVMP